jgi:hypothetical protein
MDSGAMLYILSFIKIGSGLQTVSIFCLNNLRDCNVGITDGLDLLSELLRWTQTPSYTY